MEVLYYAFDLSYLYLYLSYLSYYAHFHLENVCHKSVFLIHFNPQTLLSSLSCIRFAHEFYLKSVDEIYLGTSDILFNQLLRHWGRLK